MKEIKLIKDKCSEIIDISRKNILKCVSKENNVFVELTDVKGNCNRYRAKLEDNVSEYNSLCFLTGEETATIKYKLE